MKRIILTTALLCCLYLLNAQNLNGVTFGFGAGYSILQKDIYDYSLTPDESHLLQTQQLSKGRFVISSVISVKLGKLKFDKATEQLMMQKANPNKTEKFFSKFSVNATLNLLEANADNVSFNKGIDGGLGLGYFLSSNVQISLCYEMQSIRQMRDYVLNAYTGKSIPNGTEFYNALDQTDDNLFYNKIIPCFSFKMVYSLANKKEPE